MKILYIRTNDISFDSRAEKEILALSEIDGASIDVLGWKRDGNNSKTIVKDLYQIQNLTLNRYLVDVYAPWGRGGKKNFLPLLSFMKMIKKWVKKHISEYDVVHCVDLPTAFYVAPIIKKNNKRFVYDIFDYFSDLKKYPLIIKKYFSSAENRCISKADVTIICTEERKKQIGNAKYNKLVVIHNSPDVCADYNNASDVNHTPIFCYVGNLVSERSIDLILAFHEKHPEYVLEIGGIGCLSQNVEDYALRNSNIHFHGKMKYSDVLLLEQKCDILYALYNPSIPNHKFIAPNKFYEALSLGKRLICFKNTGLDDFFLKNDIGVLIEPNIMSLEKGVEKMLNNRDMWMELGKQEQRLFNECFSWKIMKRKLQEIYESFKD